MKVLRIGIASVDEFKARTIAIAAGRRKVRANDPKIWFNSAQSLGKLIDHNWPLLQEIRRRPPKSMTELAARTGRSLSNLSRTLKSLQLRGLLSIEIGDGLSKRPVVSYDRIEVVTRSVRGCRMKPGSCWVSQELDGARRSPRQGPACPGGARHSYRSGKFSLL